MVESSADAADGSVPVKSEPLARPCHSARTRLPELQVSEAHTSTRPVVLHARVVTGTGGGPDKTILNSPRFLRDLGYDSVCAYLHPPNDPGFDVLKQRAEGLEAELISIPDRGLRDLSVISRMLRLCRDRNVSIWHGHDYKSDALGLLLRRFHSMKLVSTVHGWGVRSRKTPLYHAIDRYSLKSYDRVICVSDRLLSECLSVGVPIGNCCEVDNAIDLTNYESLPAKEAAKVQLGIDPELPTVVAVGRLSQEKAFDILIRAFDDLLETGLDATLVIAGDGPERAALQQLIESLGREGSVRLTGHVADPRTIYAAADAFALSSLSEGLPNSLLEAMACEVSVVATTVGAIPNVITDDFNGLLVPPGEIAPLALALTRLLSNSVLQEQLATNGRSTIEQRYSFERRMQKIAAVYDSVLLRDDFANGRLETECRAEASTASVGCDKRSEFKTRCAGAGNDWNLLPPTSPPDLRAGTPRLTFSPLVTPYRHDSESDGAVTAVGVPTQTTVPRSARPAVIADPALHVELTSTPETWRDYLTSKGQAGFYQQAAWLRVLRNGLGHQPVCLQATSAGELVGVLPMAFVQTRLFGRFLVSLPYLNSSGIVAETPEVASALVDRAIDFAEQLDVRYLELRHEVAVDHPRLTEAVTDKVHMRLSLPQTTDELWNSLKSKLRSQVRKPLNNESLSVHWGTHDLLDEFYSVFTQNMRDLGTPSFSRRLFASMLDEFPGDAEICSIRLDGQPVASGILIHGPGVTQVPSASSLRQFNSSSANMLMYWHLLARSIERGQPVFDFGRSSRGTGTHKFKAQWGAKEFPAVWQHFVRQGAATDMRPNSGKYDLMIRTWQKLPVWLTKVIGPSIVRGIP
jgi:serine/alanine adding enzyme